MNDLPDVVKSYSRIQADQNFSGASWATKKFF